MQTHIVEGDFANIARACDDANEGIQECCSLLRIEDAISDGMPGSNAAAAFKKATAHLAMAQQSLLNATSDISEAAFIVERDFRDTDVVQAEGLLGIAYELENSDYLSYGEDV